MPVAWLRKIIDQNMAPDVLSEHPELNGLKAEDKQALLALYKARGGKLGVVFAADQGVVTKLSLHPHDTLALWSMPPEIGLLRGLRALTVRGAQLKEPFPEEIGNLASLEDMILYEYPHARLSEGIGRLKRLKRLYAANSALVALPESLGSLEALAWLQMRNVPLASLPESTGKLRSLEVLEITSAALETLPDSVGQLASLRECLLRHNRLRTLPSSFSACAKLEALDLGGNPLATIPAALYGMPGLQRLSLFDCGLSGPLPAELFHMPALSYLNVSQNHFSGPVPEDFSQAPSLQTLILTNNPELAGTLPVVLATQKMRTVTLFGTRLAHAPEDALIDKARWEREAPRIIFMEEDDSAWRGGLTFNLPQALTPIRLKRDTYGYQSGDKPIRVWDKEIALFISVDDPSGSLAAMNGATLKAWVDKREKELAAALDALEGMDLVSGILQPCAVETFSWTTDYVRYGTLDDEGQHPIRNAEDLADHLVVTEVCAEISAKGDVRLSLSIESYEYVFGGHSLNATINNGMVTDCGM